MERRKTAQSIRSRSKRSSCRALFAGSATWTGFVRAAVISAVVAPLTSVLTAVFFSILAMLSYCLFVSPVIYALSWELRLTRKTAISSSSLSWNLVEQVLLLVGQHVAELRPEQAAPPRRLCGCRACRSPSAACRRSRRLSEIAALSPFFASRRVVPVVLYLLHPADDVALLVHQQHRGLQPSRDHVHSEDRGMRHPEDVVRQRLDHARERERLPAVSLSLFFSASSHSL